MIADVTSGIPVATIADATIAVGTTEAVTIEAAMTSARRILPIPFRSWRPVSRAFDAPEALPSSS
jgi:hypothetical protein